MAAVIVVIGVAGALGGLIVYSAVVGAVVLSALWGWFVTPSFGIPVPPLPMLAGIALTAHFLTSHTTTTYQDHKANTGQDTLLGFLMPWFVLLIGWLIHLWAGG